jgi:hypothetical protein
MPDITISEDALPRMLKQAVGEALEEQRDLLHEIVAEVLEDYAIADAIRKGQHTGPVSRDEIFDRLLGES